MKFDRRRVLAATIGLAVIGSFAGVALGSPPFGIVATDEVPRADLNERARVNSDGIKFKTKARTDVRIQKVTFAPGGRTGWHHHPGFVLVAVQSGQVTVLDSDCNAKTYGPGLPNGSAFTESGDEPLEVRNASNSASATVFATLVVPDGAPFRIEDDPVVCPPEDEDDDGDDDEDEDDDDD
jgi:hypothetical protein